MGGNFWLRCFQIVEARQNLLSRTVGTAGALPGPRSHSGGIGVPHRTEPPNPPLAGGRHLGGQQRAVFLRVPLTGKLRELGGHIVFAGNDHPPGADRAAGPVQRAGLDGDAP